MPRRASCEEHRDELAADLVVSADGAMWRPTEPSVAIAAEGPARARPDRHRPERRPALGPPRRCRPESEPRARRDRRRPAHARRRGRGRRASTTTSRRSARSTATPSSASRSTRRPTAGEVGVPALHGEPGYTHARAALDPAHARGERDPGRRLLHGHPAPRPCAHHVPARAGPGARRRSSRRSPRHVEAHVPPGVEASVEAAPGAVPAYSIAADHPAVLRRARGAPDRLPRPRAAARAHRRHAARGGRSSSRSSV